METSKLKILMLNHEFPPVGGGASPVTFELSKQLVQMGHRVDVVTMHYGEPPRFETIDGINIYRTPAIHKRPDICYTHELAAYVPGALIKTFRLAKREKYDIAGSDMSSEAIAYGRKKYGDIKPNIQATEELQFENETFDIVLSFDLLEHIAKVDRHIREVFRVLPPGGYYIFQTPNKYSNITFETIQTRKLQWRHYHPSLHSPCQLKRRLSRHEFKTNFVKINPVNEFTVKKFKKLGPVSNISKHINFRRLPLILQTNLYVIAHKLYISGTQDGKDYESGALGQTL
jgi:SAM-dependent methyltransferase